MIVTSEYIFNNPKSNERNDIINNTMLERDRKYDGSCCRKVEFKYNNKFFIKIKNKTKK